MYGIGTSCSSAATDGAAGAIVLMVPCSSGLGGERLDDEAARPLRIDAVGREAGRGILKNALGIAPLHVLLVGVLELDAERAGEGRQVVLEGDRPLGLEPA